MLRIALELQGYPEHLLSQVRDLIAAGKLGTVLEKRYPGTHDFATDKALWQRFSSTVPSFPAAIRSRTWESKCSG